MTLEDAARYRLDHWRERWQCDPRCTAGGPFDVHNGRCRSVHPAHHPTVGLLAPGGHGWSW